MVRPIVGCTAGGIVGYIIAPNGEVVELVGRVTLVLHARLEVEDTALLERVAQGLDSPLIKAAVQIQLAIRYLDEAIRPLVLLVLLVVHSAVVGDVEQSNPEHTLAQGQAIITGMSHDGVEFADEIYLAHGGTPLKLFFCNKKPLTKE